MPLVDDEIDEMDDTDEDEEEEDEEDDEVGDELEKRSDEVPFEPR